MRSEYISAWDEFCAGATRESRIVRQADKIDMALQAVTYRDKRGAADSDVSIFIDAARAAVQDESAREMLTEIAPDDNPP